MTQDARWWERVDARRRADGWSVDELLDRLGISRPSWYEYRKHPDRHPRNRLVIKAIADYLRENEVALAAEMGLEGLPQPADFLALTASRALSAQLARQHVASLAYALGMAPDATPQDEDGSSQEAAVVVRLLLQRLASRSDAVPVAVTVRPVSRGARRRTSYQHQICVVPDEFLREDPSPTHAQRVLGDLRDQVEEALSGLLIQVTVEHSVELHPPLLRGRAVVLVLPTLLAMRPAPWSGQAPADAHEIICLGPYYAGAPDVGALLARSLDRAFTLVDHVARMMVPSGLTGLPDSRLSAVTAHVMRSVVGGQLPVAGPGVWAIDDAEAMLPRLRESGAVLADGRRRVVLLEADDALRAYAAERLCAVRAPGATDEAEWYRRLTNLQEQLRDVVEPLGGRIIQEVALPSQVRTIDGRYPHDEVDPLFDRYVETAEAVEAALKGSS